MTWPGRPEGDKVKNLSSLRRFMPHLMPTRTESAVYFEQTLRVEQTLAWLEAHNKDLAPENQVGLFHLILAAMVRVFAQRDRLNRFVVGRRIYQRKELSISFAVKKAMSDDSAMTTVKVTFSPEDGPDQVASKTRQVVNAGRSADLSTSEKEMGLVSKLPGVFIRLLMSLQRQLDAWNLLPGIMLKDDPLYASLFVANMGSIGLDAPFHHLFEYGTVPVFATIGQIKQAPVVTPEGELAVGQVMVIRYTLDERIADGYYCARSLELVQQWTEDPSSLLQP